MKIKTIFAGAGAALALAASAIAAAGCGNSGGGGEVGSEVGRAEQAICTPITCDNDDATCGTIPNGCGGTESCGTCPKGQVCTSNNCYPANCVPLTCGQVGSNCGESGNGCGGTLDCGTCPEGAYCNSIVCVQLCDDCPPMTIPTTEFQPCSGGVCTMGEGNVGEGFAITATSSNGLSPPLDAPPFTWTVVGGGLPAGLSLAPSPSSIASTLLQGVPTTAGTSTFTLQVEDDVQRTAQQSFHITIGTGNLDGISITNATYTVKSQSLSVAANDPNTDAVLTVVGTATGNQIGALKTSGGGIYDGTFEMTRTLTPTNITVKSSRGASASSSVTFNTKY